MNTNGRFKDRSRPTIVKDITFSSDDLAVFEQASLDSNPIHTSEEYIRTTHFQSVVVFGALIILRMLRCASVAHGIRRIVASFIGPVHANIEYKLLTTKLSAGRTRLLLKDGSRVLTEALVSQEFSDDLNKANFSAGSDDTAVSPFDNDVKLPDITMGRVTGNYELSAYYIAALKDALALETSDSTFPLQPLLWTSYLAGMKLPGREALLLGLDLYVVNLRASDLSFSYRAHSENVAHNGVAHIQGELCVEGTIAARVSLKSLLRRPMPRMAREFLLDNICEVKAMDDKVSLVIGGTRGLGEVLTHGLSMKGCNVIATYATSDDRARSVQQDCDNNFIGRSLVLKSDARDIDSCKQLSEWISARYGRLDYLFLVATPPIQPLSVAFTSVKRINAFIQQSIFAISIPLATFAELLEASAGTIVLISSVNSTVDLALWGHYRAAKLAGESLVRSMVLEYSNIRCLLVRPPRFVSDQTTFATWDSKTLPREEIGAAILRSLESGITPKQRVFILENMDQQ